MAMTYISTHTASGDASLAITSGIDSTYKLYVLKFFDWNPATDSSDLSILEFQVNASGQSGYNELNQSTMFRATHGEDDSGGSLGYLVGEDIANGTGYHHLIPAGTGAQADECAAGTFWLFNPAGTTYVKHWMCELSSYGGANLNEHTFSAGYFNFTAALTNILFKHHSDCDFDGTIKLYGVG